MLNDKKKKNLLSRVLDKDYPTSVNSGLIQTFQCPKFRNGTFRREKKKTYNCNWSDEYLTNIKEL